MARCFLSEVLGLCYVFVWISFCPGVYAQVGIVFLFFYALSVSPLFYILFALQLKEFHSRKSEVFYDWYGIFYQVVDILNFKCASEGF